MLVLIIAAALVSGLPGCTAPRASVPPALVSHADTPPPGAYQIQRGDLLAIQFFNNPEFSQNATVRPDGKITLPYIDEVRVAGLTPAEVDATITARFRQVLLRPEITVIVREFASQRVYVGGEVGRPGLVALTGRTTALQAILSAGGFLDTARTGQVLLIRRGHDNRPLGHALDLAQGLKAGQSGEDVVLQPLDLVYVPKTRIAEVNRFVDQYIRRLLPVPGSFGFSIP